MKEIRLGLESGIDVSRYLNSEISWERMKEIRENLEGYKTLGDILGKYKLEDYSDKE